jgi:hypothetical protein
MIHCQQRKPLDVGDSTLVMVSYKTNKTNNRKTRVRKFRTCGCAEEFR